jgi:uncharacterized membrane protein
LNPGVDWSLPRLVSALETEIWRTAFNVCFQFQRIAPLHIGLLNGGTIIDNGVLQMMPNQMIITPQVNYQLRATSDFSSVEHQKARGVTLLQFPLVCSCLI